MFFFIGGVEDRPTLIDEGPYPCPNCNAREAAVYRLDRYITFFFIPVIPISRGRTMLQCHACGYAEDDRTAEMRARGGAANPLGLRGFGGGGGSEAGAGRTPGSSGGDYADGPATGPGGGGGAGSPYRASARDCHNCGARLASEFRFCPYCGEAQER